MSNVENVIETLEGLFEGQTYTEEERSRIAGYVKNTLEVPGTIWSLEDFEAEADEDLTLEERDKVCREAYNSMSNDLSETDWEAIRSSLEEPTAVALSERPVELGELYRLDYLGESVKKYSGAVLGTFSLGAEYTQDTHPTGIEIANSAKNRKLGAYVYFKVEQVGESFKVREMIYR